MNNTILMFSGQAVNTHQGARNSCSGGGRYCKRLLISLHAVVLLQIVMVSPGTQLMKNHESQS